MKKWIILAALALTAGAAAQEPKHENETALSGRWCLQHGGIPEFRLADGARVDCLLENYAVEHDFGKAGKGYECLGQAAYYGAETGRQAVCVLIWRDDEQPLAEFQKYARRAVVASTLMEVQVWCVNSTALAEVDCATGEEFGKGDG